MRPYFNAFLWLLLALALIHPCDGVSDLFRCPPTNRFFRDSAYRVTVPKEHAPAQGTFLPILSDVKPGSKKVTLAIMPIHGARREQEDYFNELHNIAEKQRRGRTVVVAPAFQADPCYANEWPPNKHAGKIPSPTWGEKGSTPPYYTGNAGGPEDKVRLSSFIAMDLVVEWTINNYPSLQHVVVTGFSAGSQMVLNYAIMSPAGTGGVVTLKDSKVSMRFIVQSPGYATYLTDERPAKSCVPLKDTGELHTCKKFQVPAQGSCDASQHYDTWKFSTGGFEDGGSAAHHYPHLLRYLKDTLNHHPWSASYRQAITDRFGTKLVHYQVGNDDTKNCVVGMCGGSCPELLTGTSRLQRMQNYVDYINNLYPHREKPASLQFGIFHGSHRDYMGFGSPFFNLWTFQEPFAPKLKHSPPMGWTTHKKTNCYPGRGAEALLGSGFAIEVESDAGCKKLCAEQTRPLCEGVTVRSGSPAQCYLLTDLNMRKCKTNDGGFTVYARSHGGKEADSDVFSLSMASMAEEEFQEEASDTGEEVMSTPWPALLLLVAVVGVGVASALPAMRRGRRSRRSAGREVALHTEMQATEPAE